MPDLSEPSQTYGSSRTRLLQTRLLFSLHPPLGSDGSVLPGGPQTLQRDLPAGLLAAVHQDSCEGAQTARAEHAMQSGRSTDASCLCGRDRNSGENAR